jgi:hypothetical protein
MQDFDSVIRTFIEDGLVSLEDGLSYATNQNNLLLQLKGLASTEDYQKREKSKAPPPAVSVPMPSPPPTQDSVLDMIE